MNKNEGRIGDPLIEISRNTKTKEMGWGCELNAKRRVKQHKTASHNVGSKNEMMKLIIFIEQKKLKTN